MRKNHHNKVNQKLNYHSPGEEILAIKMTLLDHPNDTVSEAGDAPERRSQTLKLNVSARGKGEREEERAILEVDLAI